MGRLCIGRVELYHFGVQAQSTFWSASRGLKLIKIERFLIPLNLSVSILSEIRKDNFLFCNSPLWRRLKDLKIEKIIVRLEKGRVKYQCKMK